MHVIRAPQRVHPHDLHTVTPVHVLAQVVAPAAVTATAAVVWDPADGQVLHADDAETGRPMASTTKIMTVLLALEAGTVDDVVIVSEQAAATGRIAGAATLNLAAGQQVAMRSLLAGLLLRSGNDAAVAVAEHVAGSEGAFVERMNARAAELELTGTAFTDASGLTDDPGHRASPLDLARLAQVAMAIPTFAELAGAATLTVPGLGLLRSRNELLFAYQGATGVKTGFTSLAGECLVASATRDGRTLIVTVLDADRGASFGDAAALLDYGFAAFERPQPLAAGAIATTYRWPGAEVQLVATAALARTVPAGTEATWRTVVTPAADRPVAEGATLGVAELVVDGAVVAATDLVAGAAVAAPATDLAPAAEVGAALQEALRAFVRAQTIPRAA